MARKEKEPDVVIECDIAPDVLKWCLKNGLLEKQMILRLTEKGAKMLVDDMAAKTKTRKRKRGIPVKVK